jgi:hypothetical protein
MKTGLIFAVALAATTAHAQAVVGTGATGHPASSPFNNLYDRQNEQIVVGKVVGKGVARPEPGMAESMSLLVKTPKGATVTVELGPRWFVANQVAHVNLNDRVKVIGSTVNWHGGPVLLAKQVVNQKTLKVLAVRDLQGFPYWVAARVATNVKPPSSAIDGEVLSSNTVSVNGVPYAGYLVKTANGNVNVVTAPTWYMNGQDYSVQVGNHVQIVEGSRPLNLGNNVIVADTMYSNGSAMVFQNNGYPVWYGYGGGN